MSWNAHRLVFVNVYRDVSFTYVPNTAGLNTVISVSVPVFSNKMEIWNDLEN